MEKSTELRKAGEARRSVPTWHSPCIISNQVPKYFPCTLFPNTIIVVYGVAHLRMTHAQWNSASDIEFPPLPHKEQTAFLAVRCRQLFREDANLRRLASHTYTYVGVSLSSVKPAQWIHETLPKSVFKLLQDCTGNRDTSCPRGV
jgi:hypothetical protein